ncbi:MAG TPA: NAD(P)-dependent alcohol dehydrogenase [Steroidobacteraceae bacterium]|nr:NAD(P)-dependent alcohol dehydrogenase [Steroidobacteraceae bacterium]
MRALLRKKWVWITVLALILIVSLPVLLSPAPTLPRGSGEPMQAIVYREYGTADVLRLEQTEKPLPNDNQVLIKVRAASINPLDWHYMRGTPYLMRVGGTGLRKPNDPRLGTDVAGVVEAVGKNVTDFKPGDEVFGASGGAFAEYAVASKVALKPARLTFEQAAAVPVAGLTALQGLRDRGRLRAGQKVLINGASGGVGTFAVQIAKSYGVEVTGVCSTRNVDLVRSLGADRVVDYTKDDFTAGPERYDLIFDTVGNRSLSEVRRVLVEKGIYVGIGGGGPDAGKWIGPLVQPVKMLVYSPFVSQELGTFIAKVTKEDLDTLKMLMETGKVTPVVDRTYPLAETAAAIRYVEAGHARGKVVVTVP